MSDDNSKPQLVSSDTDTDTARDILLWRRKKMSILVVVISSVTWVLLDVYQFNFITVASWAAMFVITSLFVYGNLFRLFRKEEPKLPAGMEISEERTIETANSARRILETGISWMLHVSAERDCLVFVRVVAFFCLFAYVGTFFDFLTLAYISILGGMSVPVIYEKNKEKIKRFEEWMRMKARLFYETVDEKVFKKVMNKVVNVKHKDINNNHNSDHNEEEIKNKKKKMG